MTSEIWTIIFLSLKVAGFALLWTVPVAFLLAYILAKQRFWGRAFLSAIIMLPLVMPPVVTGLLLLYIFGPQAFLGQVLQEVGVSFAFNAAGASLAAGLVALPLIVRPIRLSLEAIDPRLDEALIVAGKTKWQRFKLLDVPMALPGILAGGILGFAKALGEFGATVTFVANIPGETQTFSLAIHAALQRFDGQSMVVFLSVISIGISVVAVVGSEYVLKWLQRRLNGDQEMRHA